MAAQTIIRLKDVSRVYKMAAGEVLALKKVSFEVKSGEFVSIMGPSGSGKSTLLNIIGCLHKPTLGIYIFEKTNVDQLTDNELAKIRNKKIGFIFQSINLLPRLTALKNVEIPLIYQGIRKSRRIKLARASLESVGLEDRIYHKPSELSGGELQRVAIARALVINPSILLADEPTGNLDSACGTEIMKIFTNLNKNGITIVLITHENIIAQYAHRIISIKDGSIVSDVLSS